MQPPPRDSKLRGLRWWQKLNFEEKKNEVRPLIEKYEMSNLAIIAYLDLQTIGRVASVRHKLKLEREQGQTKGPTLVVDNGFKEEPDPLSQEEQLAALIEGRWKPSNGDRPFLKLPAYKQRRLRPKVLDFIEWRQSLG